MGDYRKLFCCVDRVALWIGKAILSEKAGLAMATQDGSRRFGKGRADSDPTITLQRTHPGHSCPVFNLLPLPSSVDVVLYKSSLVDPSVQRAAFTCWAVVEKLSERQLCVSRVREWCVGEIPSGPWEALERAQIKRTHMLAPTYSLAPLRAIMKCFTHAGDDALLFPSKRCE